MAKSSRSPARRAVARRRSQPSPAPRRKQASAPAAPAAPAAAPPKAATVRARRRSRWVTRTAVALSLAVLVSAGVGHAALRGLDRGIDRVDPFKDMKNRPEPGHGMNVLLVGTDGRDQITERERRKYRLGGEPCHCTDTIMIVHISGDRERASVVSLPRDSYVVIPAHRDEATGQERAAHPVKLNAAYAEGGPQLAVRTVEHMTHVKVDHYLEIDFTSFMKTVDVLGGVRICTTRPMKDSYTGLDLPAGTHVLDGGRALQYVRSRHIDGAADLSRMRRQQRFMAALIAKATSSGVLLNPVKIREVTSTVLGSMRADKEFDANEMLELGQAMRGLTPSSSEFTTVPIEDAAYPVRGIGSTVRWAPAASRRLFTALREDKALTAPRPADRTKAAAVPVAPQQIRVQVENGTRTTGLGKRVDGALRATGFRTTGAPVNASRDDVRRTVVEYDPRWDRSAESVATALPGSELRAVAGRGGLLKVIAGTDFHEVVRVRGPAPGGPSGGGVVTGDAVSCD